jgi:molybdopterin-guanine dinucleotide biosynthesis protein A
MGTDKATFLFRGKRLWQIQLETLRKMGPKEILVSARTDPSWRPDGIHFIADVPPSRGPLSGLAASLGRMSASHLLALAIDMPCMSNKYLEFLCTQIEPGCGVVPGITDHAEPLAAIYPREAAVDLRNTLESGDYSLQSMTRRLVGCGKLRQIPVADYDKPLFLNVNELADLKSA